MASLSAGQKALTIRLSSAERRLFGRPNISIELNRVQAAQMENLPSRAKLGIRATRRVLFGGLTGEWRNGSSRVLIFGGKPGTASLRITLKHPTIDEIWYSGRDAQSIAEKLSS